MNPSPHDLIARCLRDPSDRRALDDLVRSYAKPVMSMIRSTFMKYSCAPGPEAEDLFQEVFLTLFRDNCRVLKSFDGARAGFLTFLLTIARNQTLNRVRLRGRNVDLDEELFESDEHSDDRVEKREEKEALRAALSELTPKELLFFRLYFQQHLAPEAIARIMGIGVDTVYSKKAKLVEKLKVSCANGTSGTKI